MDFFNKYFSILTFILFVIWIIAIFFASNIILLLLIVIYALFILIYFWLMDFKLDNIISYSILWFIWFSVFWLGFFLFSLYWLIIFLSFDKLKN